MIDGIEQPGEQPGKPTANTSSPRVVDEQQSYDQQDRTTRRREQGGPTHTNGSSRLKPRSTQHPRGGVNRNTIKLGWGCEQGDLPVPSSDQDHISLQEPEVGYLAEEQLNASLTMEHSQQIELRSSSASYSPGGASRAECLKHNREQRRTSPPYGEGTSKARRVGDIQTASTQEIGQGAIIIQETPEVMLPLAILSTFSQ
jgi:hypothetical protein